ncbi:MAG TPA: TAXI family TRAP transporter solute-binding subunit [Candidatus Methylomirabilis sp.]|nr:TAXI family TRAP transporter solute-binding subunit [Candidatus Methylomirabilis sp.]
MSHRRCAALVLLSLALVSACPAAATELRFMTGPQGGSWYPLGGAIADIIKREVPGVSASVVPGAGIANVKGVEVGKAELGFGNSSSTVDGVLGRDPFTEPTRHVRQVATLYLQYFQVVVREATGIRSVKDFRGRALTTQQKGNTGEQMTRDLLQIHGLSYKDLRSVSHVSYSDSVSQMKDNHAQVFSLVTTVPAGAILDVAASHKIRLVGITAADFESLQKLNRGYAKRVIPKGTYPGVEEDVTTFGTYTHLIARADLSEDLVYRITKALHKHAGDLGNVVQAVKGLDLKEMAFDVGVPYHPGAAKYYREAGVLAVR